MHMIDIMNIGILRLSNVYYILNHSVIILNGDRWDTLVR